MYGRKLNTRAYYTQPYFWPARTRVSVMLRVSECVAEAAWTRQSKLHTHSSVSVFFFYLTHSFSFLVVSLQPHVYGAHPRVADTESPLSGAGGVHCAVPGCGSTSFGDHVRLGFTFVRPCFSKVGLEESRTALNEFLICFVFSSLTKWLSLFR